MLCWVHTLLLFQHHYYYSYHSVDDVDCPHYRHSVNDDEVCEAQREEPGREDTGTEDDGADAATAHSVTFRARALSCVLSTSPSQIETVQGQGPTCTSLSIFTLKFVCDLGQFFLP